MIRWLDNRYSAPLVRDTAVAFVAVLLTVESIIATYYSIFEPDRLIVEMIISAFVTLVAGVPAIWILSQRSQRSNALSYRLRRLNDLDQATGLLNLQAFTRDAQLLLDTTRVKASAGAFAHIEVGESRDLADDFERDRVFRSIATTIRETTRSADLGVRLGDRQFGVFIKDVNSAKAAQIMGRLLKEIDRRQKMVGLAPDSVQISIGIAEHRPGESLRTAMEEAFQGLAVARGADKHDPVVVHFRSHRAA
ncbi:MAG: diguanylate cyclase [Rhizobiaceae bacterium]